MQWQATSTAVVVSTSLHAYNALEALAPLSMPVPVSVSVVRAPAGSRTRSPPNCGIGRTVLYTGTPGTPLTTLPRSLGNLRSLKLLVISGTQDDQNPVVVSLEEKDVTSRFKIIYASSIEDD